MAAKIADLSASRVAEFEAAGADLLLLNSSPQIEEMEYFAETVIRPQRGRNGNGLKDSQEGHQIRFLLLRQVELLNQVEKLHCVLECQ